MSLRCIFFLQIPIKWVYKFIYSLQWCHNGRDGVSNHQPRDCLLYRLFKAQAIYTDYSEYHGIIVMFNLTNMVYSYITILSLVGITGIPGFSLSQYTWFAVSIRIVVTKYRCIAMHRWIVTPLYLTNIVFVWLTSIKSISHLQHQLISNCTSLFVKSQENVYHV